MNKKSHKKKQKKKSKGDAGRNKENIVEDGDEVEVKDDKPRKKDKNLCYEVKHSEVMGRYLVAARDIKAGELIIEEPALAVGPCSGCGIVCLGCYRELDDNNIFKCPGCQWPLCAARCAGRGGRTGHSPAECAALRPAPPDYARLDDLRDSYHAIMPLRCLLLKEHSPSRWAALSRMEAHNALRRARGDIWPHNQARVVDRLRRWGCPYDADEVHTVCGILEVNAFEVGGAGASARALYDRAYLLAHACTPSTAHTDAADARRALRVRAAVPLRRGDLLALCYAYTLQGTLKRREHLLHSKFFECACARCADPTELGSHASAFVCPRCGGRVQAPRPLRAEPWACAAACGYRMPLRHVRLLLHRLTEEYEQIDANDVPGFEAFLHKYRNVIHPSHYLSLSAKHSLSQLYGKVAGYMIHEMPHRLLHRKVDICRDLMKVFDIIEPGYSRLRGVTLYELHAPLMILTTRDFEKKAISKDELRTRLKEIVSYLTEAALILGFEPPQAPEGLMAAAAREALTKIRTWEQILGKIS